MFSVFTVTLQNLVPFFVFFLSGIYISSSKKVPEDTGKAVSSLITLIFMPCMTFNTFAQNFTRAGIGQYITLFLLGFGVIVVSLLPSMLMKRFFPGNRFEKLAAEYSMVAPNYGYIGYPLVLAMFGQEALTKFMMFCIPVNFYAYMYYYPQFSAESNDTGIQKLKRFMSPANVGMLLGMVYGLSGLKYPELIKSICSTASSCVAPCAMLVTGITLGGATLRRAFSQKRAYLVSFLRLAVLPVGLIFLSYCLSKCFGITQEQLRVIGSYVCLPLGMNPVIFALAFDKDGTFGAECALISLLMSLFTMPLFYMLLEFLVSRV